MSDTVTQMLVGENLRKVLEAQPLNPLGQLTLAEGPTTFEVPASFIQACKEADAGMVKEFDL